MFKLLDKIAADAISSRTLTPEGYLDVRARISRVGIQEYYAFELGDLFSDRDPFSVISVYRPADEVFRQQSLDSFAKKPVTVDHPWEGVTASNHKDVAVGFSGETMTRDGNFMSGSLRLTVADAVNRVQRGEGELSAGYTCDITRESGTYEGQPYDAVQRNILGNHIALVDAGRCGPLCRVGDRAPQMVLDKASAKDCGCNKETAMNAVTNPPVQLQAISHDGFMGQADANGAMIVKKLQDSLAALQKTVEKHEGTIAAMTTSHADALKAKDKEVADAKALQMDAAKMDAAVAARAELIANAKKLLGDRYDFKGKSDADIRKEAVIKKMGDKAKDKTESYYDSAFEVLLDQVGDGRGGDRRRGGDDDDQDDLRDRMRDSNSRRDDDKDPEAALEKYRQKQADRWKNAGRVKA